MENDKGEVNSDMWQHAKSKSAAKGQKISVPRQQVTVVN